MPHHSVIRLAANAGKGAATRAGVARARGRAIVFMDADLATDPNDLAALRGALDRSDVAIGSRTDPSSLVIGTTQTRAVMARAFNLACRAACGFEHRDTQCGFKAFRAPAGKVLFHLSRANGFAFDVELLLLASRLGLRVGEIPVRWTAIEGSKIRPWRDPAHMLTDVARARLRWRRGRPLAAVAALCGDAEEAGQVATELRQHMRKADPVLAWGTAAVGLLPCTDAGSAIAVTDRLGRRLPGWRFDISELPTTTLVPRSGGILRSALAA